MYSTLYTITALPLTAVYFVHCTLDVLHSITVFKVCWYLMQSTSVFIFVGNLGTDRQTANMITCTVTLYSACAGES